MLPQRQLRIKKPGAPIFKQHEDVVLVGGIHDKQRVKIINKAPTVTYTVRDGHVHYHRVSIEDANGVCIVFYKYSSLSDVLAIKMLINDY